jgi:Glycosyl hydrolase family 63 C-terminal domain
MPPKASPKSSSKPSPKPAAKISAERRRLANDKAGKENWRQWGPYVSERQWGTVREDYSGGGNAWEYLPHDHARSRAYRWGEDGIAGFSDDNQYLCLSLALWNGQDPILKERLFGLTNSEGNHGEDVKELYYYLDATPSQSYLKMLYKYPQAAFPYSQLVEENRRRGAEQMEFELLDTGLFDDDRYFDVFVEYAKAAPDDVLMQITAHNRGPDSAPLTLLPQLFCRNTWSWTPDVEKPRIVGRPGGAEIQHPELGKFRLDFAGEPKLLFCDNETNARRIFGSESAIGYFKDAFHECIVEGKHSAVNPDQTGTKVGGLYELVVPAGTAATVRLRLSPNKGPSGVRRPFADFDSIFAKSRLEADEFYAELQQRIVVEDEKLVQRQAFAGMIWSKMFFRYGVEEWLEGDPRQPPPPAARKTGRNRDWRHLDAADVIAMPDKWEYPWFAAWDLAFHCIAFAVIDAEFAKSQLLMLARDCYMHPNGQFPAYEWAFGDVNPPVHAWSAWRVFQIDRRQRQEVNPKYAGDLEFLKRMFNKMLLNFDWWVNRKDAQGRNIFQGGFLGLDNISVFDRSSALESGSSINQADGTSWMAMYCLNLLRISLELALHDRAYEDIATKFLQHFLSIAGAINGVGEDGTTGLWDEADRFYYDQLVLPEGSVVPIKVHSIVGLVPLFANMVLEPEVLRHLPEFSKRLEWFLKHRPKLAALVSNWEVAGEGDRRLLSLLRGRRMTDLLHHMLDETKFLSDYGVRALSKTHEQNPFCLDSGGVHHEVGYWPGESRNGLFGGNSNWRGPIWMPINYLIIEALQRFHYYYGDDFKVECPTGSGKFLTLLQIAEVLGKRLSSLFLKGPDGKRPVLNYHSKLAGDPHFRDYILFHEYFHGDSGRGAGASHQTGWTGLVAKLLQPHTTEVATIRATLLKAAVENVTSRRSPGDE